jgi:hypothetical protein
VQVVKHPRNNCEAFTLNTSTTKKKKKRKEGRREGAKERGREGGRKRKFQSKIFQYQKCVVPT